MTDVEKIVELLRLGADPKFDSICICDRVACKRCSFSVNHTGQSPDCTVNISAKTIRKLLPKVKQLRPEYFV